MNTTIRFFQYLCLLLCVGCTQAKEKNMQKIQFDIGRDITLTAKESNAPHFSVRNLHGLVSYSINDLPPSIVVAYKRPHYEVDIPSPFAMTMYADEANENGLAVSIVTLQVSGEGIKTHQSAQRYIEKLLQQFNQGKWIRYVDDNCPVLTGRSVYLDETGLLKRNSGCGLDPYYSIPQGDWPQLFTSPQHYVWTGDGVFAELTVYCSGGSENVTYDIGLEFRDFQIKQRNDKQRLAKSLAEGDKKGWNSTANHIKEQQERAAQNKILEENAVKRGDPLFTRK